jgi:hypothetical protein
LLCNHIDYIILKAVQIAISPDVLGSNRGSGSDIDINRVTISVEDIRDIYYKLPEKSGNKSQNTSLSSYGNKTDKIIIIITVWLQEQMAMDWNVVQKISTPLQLAGVVVLGIITVAGDYAKISSSPLALVSVAILGGLGVLAVVVMVVAKKQQDKFVVQSGIMRAQILIEWITKFRERTSDIAVCRELEARLQELEGSLNYALGKR